MNRVHAPDGVEIDTIQDSMMSEDIIDFIENDRNLPVLQNEELNDVLWLVTSSFVTDSGMELPDLDREGSDFLSKWVENGANTIDLCSQRSMGANCLVDGAVLPMRFEVLDDGEAKELFVEGKKLLKGAEQLELHDIATVSLPYLDTSPDGILHVIPAWSQREVIEDISYRFKAGRVMKTEIPFLGGLRCTKRTYECLGVMVCPKSTSEFCDTHHDKVQERNEEVLNTISLFEETEVMKRNALHIFRDVRSKKNYCSVCLWGVNKVPKMCDGKPVVRERSREALYGSKYFLGCTGYHRAPQARHTIRKLDSLDHEGLNFLRALLAGKITPQDVDRDKSCTYVHGKKKRGTTLCQVHKEPLVHIPCEKHRMNVFEPVSQDGVDIPKMVYVSCFGSHTHPPPPPPNHTLRKMRLLEAEVEKDPLATNAVLRKRVEEKVMSQAVGGKPNGSAHVPVGSSGRKIRTLREKKRKVFSDAEGLLALTMDQTFQYCRDMKVFGPSIVVTCAH